MAGHDQGTPEAQRIRFRLGVNLGDVIVDGNDIYGDGVNVAARLEGLAEPGGICISGTVFDHAANKADVGFAKFGEQRLKNIANPVRVYRVLLDPGDAGKKAGRSNRSRKRLKILAGTGALLIGFLAFAFEWQKPLTPRRPSVAVLAVAAPPAARFADDPQSRGADVRQRGSARGIGGLAAAVAMSAKRRLLHHNEARAMQVSDEQFCNDGRHEFVGVMPAFFALEFQREGEGVGQVVGIGRREPFEGVGHCAKIAQRCEQIKNIEDLARRQGRTPSEAVVTRSQLKEPREFS